MTHLPPLPLEEWESTKETLHLWLQIVGKVRLGIAPPQNHWWHSPLYVDTRGLTTRRLRSNDVDFDVSFDLVDHALVVRTSRGDVDFFPLRHGLSVADFYERFMTILAERGIRAEIKPGPYEVRTTTPFAEDTGHASYDREAVARFWEALRWIDWTLQEFAGWFCGKTSPVHVFWHGFDIAVTRFLGRRAPERPQADRVTQEAYSHEVISFGFWPGDEKVREPAFYSYTFRSWRPRTPKRSETGQGLPWVSKTACTRCLRLERWRTRCKRQRARSRSARTSGSGSQIAGTKSRRESSASTQASMRSVLQASGASPFTFCASAISTCQPASSSRSCTNRAPFIDSIAARIGAR
jgi:Family of unknown function (DUF5996)